MAILLTYAPADQFPDVVALLADRMRKSSDSMHQFGAIDTHSQYLTNRAESAFLFILTGRFDDVLSVIKKFVPGSTVDSLLV